MTRIYRVLVMAALSVLAMSALGASAAQAAPLGHLEKTPAFVTGEQVEQHVFTTHAGTFRCASSKFSHTLTEATFTTLTLDATYEDCPAFGFLNATVNMNGCDYLFHIVEGSSPPTATIDTVCPTGKTIEVVASGCKMTWPAQTGLSHVVLSNAGSGSTRDVDANFTVSGITYTLSGFFCPNGTGTFHEGTYTGTATLRAYEDNEGVEGSQIGAWVE